MIAKNESSFSERVKCYLMLVRERESIEGVNNELLLIAH